MRTEHAAGTTEGPTEDDRSAERDRRRAQQVRDEAAAWRLASTRDHDAPKTLGALICDALASGETQRHFAQSALEQLADDLLALSLASESGAIDGETVAKMLYRLFLRASAACEIAGRIDSAAYIHGDDDAGEVGGIDTRWTREHDATGAERVESTLRTDDVATRRPTSSPTRTSTASSPTSVTRPRRTRSRTERRRGGA